MERTGYTIRIFVADGDPEGIRVIDQMNWTGTGLVFPRALWPKVKARKEFDRAGVYILVGYGEGDDELPRVYVGEGDGIRARIDQHDHAKAFWSWGISFTSNAGALNKAHVQWLEYALVQRAKEAGQCVLDNGNAPQAPALSEHEEADIGGFLDQMLRILPLVNLRAFERVKPVAVPGAEPKPEPPLKTKLVADTVVVPAQKDGFERVFLGEQSWHAIRISRAMLDKYRLVFSAPATKIGPIPFGDAPMGSMQGPRYTTYAKLTAAKKVMDLF